MKTHWHTTRPPELPPIPWQRLELPKPEVLELWGRYALDQWIRACAKWGVVLPLPESQQ